MSDIKIISQHVAEHLKNTVDLGAITIAVGTLVKILPAIASLLSIVWILIRIYETKTVKNMIKKDAEDGIDD